MIPTKVTREEPGAEDATNSLMPVTTNEHCSSEIGESTHYPDPHCTNKFSEVEDTGMEDHPHSGVSRPTERLEKTEDPPLGDAAEAVTIENFDGLCIAEAKQDGIH